MEQDAVGCWGIRQQPANQGLNIASWLYCGGVVCIPSPLPLTVSFLLPTSLKNGGVTQLHHGCNMRGSYLVTRLRGEIDSTH